MDFAMREWLTVIVVLLIVGVLLDGWRRMRQSRQASIKMSLSMHKGTEKDDLMEYGSELPNGGARVIGERDESDTRKLTQSVQETFAQKRSPSIKARIPEQVALNLEEEVPMLMEAVDERDDSDASVATDGAGFDEADFLNELGINSADDSDLSLPGVGIKESSQIQDPITPEVTPAKRKEPADLKVEEARPEEVLIINIMAPEGQRLNGSILLDGLLECGMRYGEMQIFHRHVGADGEGAIVFSMANMVVPGTFDLNQMQNFETPGVSLFLTLPIRSNALSAFNCMAETAQYLAEMLGGELKDENRSVMTAQTLEHCRERIREFERKNLT